MDFLPAPGETFRRKKAKILSQLSVPCTEYKDASPKGSIDDGIATLIEEINRDYFNGLVTTSSCAGRVSVYLEGMKKKNKRGVWLAEHQRADAREVGGSAAGGKGGGEFLFVSHEKVNFPAGENHGWGYQSRLGLGNATKLEDNFAPDHHMMDPNTQEGLPPGFAVRLIHFKFEPMVRVFFLFFLFFLSFFFFFYLVKTSNGGWMRWMS
jgi:tRNA wybutosine-synthesizing protein 3